MTSQGSAHGRFARAIERKNLAGVEIAAREMGGLSLLDALDYVLLVAEVRPDRFEPAAVRWHGRLELESAALPLTEAQLALVALADLGRGGDHAEVLRKVLRRARPTLLRQPR